MRRTTWQQVHEELVRLARAKGAYDAEEALWLLEGKRVRVHEALGQGTYLQYLENIFGYGPRLARERLRVAEALAELPTLFAALAEGALSWSAVRELSRVAVPATEGEWISAAQGRTVREIEEMVSGRAPGDHPGDPPAPDSIRHILRLEVSGDALAAFREARRRIELDVGHNLDDDEAVRMLAHYALGGPSDPGRAAYQIAMTVCEQCGRGTRDGAGQVLPVAADQVEAACCDAQQIGMTHGGQAAPASQEIPPRIRRLVWRRDHGRCQVPGCRAAKFLEIHHVRPRALGGTHEPSGLSLLCSAHHAQIHRGALAVEGQAPDRLVFRRPKETRPSEPTMRLSPPVVAATEPSRRDAALEADALSALHGLGFATREARQAIAAASWPDTGRIEDLLRDALRILGRTAHASRVSEVIPWYGRQKTGLRAAVEGANLHTTRGASTDLMA